MPSTNPVYQPTTVNYERHKEWTANNYFTERVIPNCHQKPYLQRLLLIGAVILAIIGLSLSIYALVNDSNTHKDDPLDVFANEPIPTFNDNSSEEEYDTPIDSEDSEAISDNKEDEHKHDHERNIVLGSVGICLILLSLVMYVGFLHLRGMFQGLLPLQNQRSATHLHQAGPSAHSHESGHQSSISYKGVQQEAGTLNLEPSVPMEEERHSLMDNKFHTSEDTERMMDEDPRIVLKPLRTTDEA